MDWSPEARLNVIKALALIEYEDIGALLPDQKRDILESIIFLCDMPNEFLEANKDKFQEALIFLK